MNHERMLHFTNGVLYGVNAILWTSYAHSPWMGVMWLAISSGSFLMMRKV